MWPQATILIILPCSRSVHFSELFPTNGASACLCPGAAAASVSRSQNTLLPRSGVSAAGGGGSLPQAPAAAAVPSCGRVGASRTPWLYPSDAF